MGFCFLTLKIVTKFLVIIFKVIPLMKVFVETKCISKIREFLEKIRL